MENEQKIPAGYEEAYNFLNAKSIHEMRQLARAFGVSKPSLDKKHDLIVRVIGLASGALKPDPKSNKGAKVKGEDASAESVEKVREVVLQCKSRIPYERVDIKPKQYGFNDSGVGTGVGKMYAGLLEFDERGGGRLRGTGCEASGNDAYLSESIIRRYYLREGDRVTCLAEERDGIPQAMQVTEVEGYAPIYAERKKFGELPAAYPNEQIVFAKEDSPVYFALDALCPIGYGQRVLAVAPRETGITSFLNAAADAARRSGAKPLFVLLGQRPEEISETRKNFPDCCVAATGFDEPAMRGAYMAKLALRRAERFAERGERAVLLLDSLAALLRAYEEASAVADGKERRERALLFVKQFFAAARRLEGAGSLTIIAAAGALDASQTGEFSAAANAVLTFSESLAARGVYPAIDLVRSHSKRPQSFPGYDAAAAASARQALAGAEDAGEFLSRFMRQKESER